VRGQPRVVVPAPRPAIYALQAPSTKGITTESGNPYGAFVGDARTKLGHDPSRVELDGVSLTLGAQSTGVTALDQIYSGAVDVLFLMNDTNNSYPAG